MAGTRNLATGLIRASGRTQIALTLRWIARNPVRALLFLSQTACPAIPTLHLALPLTPSQSRRQISRNGTILGS
jgi:hypothetical protein